MVDTTAARNLAEAGMEKTGPEFYAFMAVCLILGALGLILWFQGRQALTKAKEMQATAPVPPPAAPTAPVAPVQVIIDPETLRRAVQPLLENLETKLSAEIKSINTQFAAHNEREEARFIAIEHEMREGFRGVHSRIDVHIQAHGRTR